MKTSTTVAVVAGSVAVVAVLYVLTKGTRAAVEGAKKLGNAVNPVNHDNVFAQGVNAVGGALATEPDSPGMNADGSWSLGGWWRDITSDDDEKIRAMLQGSRTSDSRAVMGTAFNSPKPEGTW